MSKTDKRKKTRAKSKTLGAPAAFLLKTYEILENPAYNDIACWNKDGTAFIVKNVTEFSDKILPKYFKHNNFASFVRQLNMYDFHKSRQENNENEFCHKLFKRGQKELLVDIKRKTTENQNEVPNQLVPMTRELDYDKFKKEAGQFSNELKTLKSRQTDLEKITKIIYGQNSILLKENKLLWSELIKNKEKYERKVEKLMLFVISILQSAGLGKNAITAGGKKGLEAADLADTIGDLGDDTLETNNALSVVPERRDTDKFFKKLSKYFQTKGNKTKIDKLLELAQNQNFTGLDDQSEVKSPPEWNLEGDQPRAQNTRSLKRGAPQNYLNDISPEDLLKSQPSKQIKLEASGDDNEGEGEGEGEYANQNFLSQQENQDLPDLGLFKAPSAIDPTLDFDLDQSTLKPFDPNSRQASITPFNNDPQYGGYNYPNHPRNMMSMSQNYSGAPVNNYDKDLFAFDPSMNQNMNMGGYSPSTFLRGDQGFGFEQPMLDESFDGKKFEDE